MSGLQMKYFVLNPTKRGPYGEASRKALLAYAGAIKAENRELWCDLHNWVGLIESQLRHDGKRRRDEPDGCAGKEGEE